MMINLVGRLFGHPPWQIAKSRRLVREIIAIDRELDAFTDRQIRTRSAELKFEARTSPSLRRLLPTAFALVRQATHRTLSMRHFPVQLLGGIAIFRGCVAEMETGEGKTLTATLPLFLRALQGRGAHLATANDYLAARDAETVTPIFDLLGMTVGVVTSDTPITQRHQAYACDITYGTATEFGFDFLRDRLTLRAQEDEADRAMPQLLQDGNIALENGQLQRSLHFVLIDEADSVLIDDARTPLVIGVRTSSDEVTTSEVGRYIWAADVCSQFHEGSDFHHDTDDNLIELTADGRALARKLPKPSVYQGVSVTSIYEFIERAIRVERGFVRDRDYVVRDEEVVIVDESTGRLAEGRKWQAGIHAAIEAKEGIAHAVSNREGSSGGHAAQTTLPELLSQYRHSSGMTGTARSSAAEFRHLYQMPVEPIATNRKCQRVRLPDHLFEDAPAKWEAIVAEIREMHLLNRPVLVGTRSINRSEALSFLLEQAGIPHRVLHAKHLEQEAEIVSEAGQPGRVTVATNMAGRGTDISLGEEVAELGGLHVICTEMHDSSRIDRQLAGRCARQGQPGSYRHFLAMDDDILADAFGAKKAEALFTDAQKNRLQLENFIPLFRRAQKAIERKHFLQRKSLIRFAEERNKRLKHAGQDPYLDSAG